MLGVFWKIQEICSKTGTRISKIDGEMSEIIEPKVGNPENSISRNWATLSHPWNLTFLENDIFKLSSYLYGLKVPKWNCAHILLWKKAKNIRKTPKNTCFTTYLIMRFFNFFLTYMVQKYQNEISPIFYYGKKLKTSGKLLKIPYLQPPDWGQP